LRKSLDFPAIVTIVEEVVIHGHLKGVELPQEHRSAAQSGQQARLGAAAARLIFMKQAFVLEKVGEAAAAVAIRDRFIIADRLAAANRIAPLGRGAHTSHFDR